jgi:ParB family chromosome partitioning protein
MAGIAKVPVIVKDLDDDAAAIVLVDSNIMRPSLLPSERAFAYKLKLDALAHQGRTCGTEFHKSRDAVDTDITGRQVANYIRLTELTPDLLNSVDEGLVAIKPAVELSYLPKEVQKMVAEQMDINLCTPSHSQTRRLRAMHEQGQLSEKTIAAVMAEEKPNQAEIIRLPVDRLKGYFPKSYTPKQIEDKLIEILEQWRKLERKRAARDSR